MRWLFLALLFFVSPLTAGDIVGFWKNPNPKTGKPKLIIAVYAHQDKHYGRILASYDTAGQLDDTIYAAEGRAKGVKGNPFYAGMDFIWNLKKKSGALCRKNHRSAQWKNL